MTENIESLILEQLRRLNGKADGIALDVIDIKSRLTSLEEGQAGVRGELAQLYTSYANQSRRIDRIDERLARIERRLDLVEEPT
ncbi:MAG TPA: hypothetical protein VG735_02435 [Caulobacterales bacterium]|nr:hypothetical protein [Caulobacterales bacterium]